MEFDTDLPIHSFCAIVPDPTPEQYQALEADILENRAIHDDITTFRGQILDGRCRAAIGKKHKIHVPSLPFQYETEIEALMFVKSKNLARRHMNSGQLAQLGVALAQQLGQRQEEQKDADENFGQGACAKKLAQPAANQSNAKNPSGKNKDGKSQSDRNKSRRKTMIAKGLGTNRQYMDDAEKLNNEAPDLAAKVKSGEINIKAAMAELKSRAAAKNGKPHDPETVLDKLGDEVPADIIPAFTEGLKEAGRMGRVIDELIRDAKEWCAGPAGYYAVFNAIKIELKNAKGYIVKNQPYAVCPDCAGARCQHCKQSGFIHEHAYKSRPEVAAAGD